MKVLSRSCKTTPPVANQYRYARLYQAMVRRAVQDMAHRQHRDEARKWLLSAESDYAFATAGISPHSVRQLIA